MITAVRLTAACLPGHSYQQHSRVTVLVLWKVVLCSTRYAVPSTLPPIAHCLPFHALGSHQRASLQANTRTRARMLSSVSLLLLDYRSKHAIGAQHAHLLH